MARSSLLNTIRRLPHRRGEPRMRDFRYFDFWHKSHAFTLNVYRSTESFPKAEAFGLASTLRRGSANVSMKIAEGCGRDENGEFLRCLQQARAMSVEIEYQLLLARDLRFMEVSAYDGLQGQVVEVRKMLSGFMKTLHTQAV
jgi:four helix bundle protein